MKRTLTAATTVLLLNNISGCTLIAAGVASSATDAKNESGANGQNKAPVIRLENDVEYSEPASRREN